MPFPASDPSLIFGDKSGIVFSANEGVNDVFVGTAAAETFFFGATSTNNENDTIVGFGRNDILVTEEALVDSNGDGYITFGRNGVLDLDGPDADQNVINFVGGPKGSVGLRILGEDANGYNVYADAAVRLMAKGAIEGTLANDTLVGTAKRDLFLFDTALDLAWGKDTINGFGSNDFVVTTSKIFDGNADGQITFINGVLDLNGDATLHGGNQKQNSPWGQVDINSDSGNVTSLFYNGEVTKNGTTYYFYSQNDGASLGFFV